MVKSVSFGNELIFFTASGLSYLSELPLKIIVECIKPI